MKLHLFRKNNVTFKRWTRQKFSVFNSLHKIINICFISLRCSFIALPFFVNAQSNDTIMLNRELKEININSDIPLHALSLPLVSLQSVASKKDIEQAPVQSLNEFLDGLLSFDMRQRGVYGTQADISYRGGNFDQTLVFVNGINFSDPQTGHYSMNLPINLDIIKSIEIYKNTSAFLFGASPFSGLIHITTKPDSIGSLNFHLMTGMYGLFKTSTSFHFQTKNIHHLISWEYNHSDGYIHNTDFTIVQGFYQANSRFKKGNLEFQMGYVQKKYGANGFYSLKYPEQYENTQTFISSLTFVNKSFVKIIPSMYYRNNKDCFQLVKGEIPGKNNYHFNHTFGINLLNYFTTKLGKTSFNADFRLENIISTSIGDTLIQPIATHLENIYYTRGVSRTHLGFSASQLYTLSNFTGNLSFLMLHFSTRKNNYYFLPAIHLSYQCKIKKHTNQSIKQNFYTAASASVRNPTFTELYYKSVDIQGNKDLLPEKAYTLEGGYNFQLIYINHSDPYFHFTANMFYRKGMDMIDFIKQKNEEIWHCINHTSISFIGIESAIKLFPQCINEKFFIESATLSYTYIYSDKQEDETYISRYVLDHLENNLKIELIHSIYKELKIGYNVSYNKRKGQYISYINNTKGVYTSFPDYFLLDIRLSYQFRTLMLYVEASNILNQRYYDFGDLVQPGIWIKGGFTCKINDF